MKIQNKKYRFPWLADNHFTLLIDGPEFFSAMLDAIHQAKHYILLEMYLVSPGNVSRRFFNTLCDAVKRGLSVYLLLDAYGCRKLTPAQLKELADCGINTCFYNPLHLHKHKLLLFRDHRKLLIVDGQTAFIGGAGLVDEFDSVKQPQFNWRENMLKVEGNNVNQWQQLFVDNWNLWSDEPALITKIEVPFIKSDHYGRVSITSGPNYLEIKRSFLNHVRNAKQRVWLSTAYFAPSGKLRRALRRAALRGIDVRLLIPGPITDHPMARYLAQSHYSKLLRDGVRIFEYQPRFMHAKLVMCDSWISMGSCNIDRWNFRWNLDANQEIDDPDFSRTTASMFEQDFADSREILLEHWNRRSWLKKIRTLFWAKLLQITDTVLTRLRIIRHWKKIHYRKPGEKQ